MRKFELFDSNVSGSIRIEGEINQSVTIKKVSGGANSFEALSFEKCKISYCVVEDVIVDKLEVVDGSGFAHDAIFRNVISKKILFNNVSIGHSINLYGVKSNQLEVDNIAQESAQRNLRISDNCILGDTLIAIGMIDDARISNSEIYNLELWGTNSDKTVFVVDQVKFSVLRFREIFNKGNFSFRQVQALNDGAQLILDSCNMGKTDCIQCRFEEFIFRFRHSKISELFISDSNFPKLVYKMDKDEVDYIQSKLAFSQLHTVYTRLGDTVQSLEYQSREIGVHYKVIKWFTEKWPFLNFTKINLALNWLSNYYGRAWMQGVVFTFLVGLFFFTCLLLSTGGYEVGIPDDSTWKLIPSFLRFMNPIRVFDLESLFKINVISSEVELGVAAYIWDFLGRVFVTYGFYQTIQAFRRYGRR